MFKFFTIGGQINKVKLMQKIYFGSDHGGFQLKQKVKDFLGKKGGYEVVDLGCDNTESCDYPKFGQAVAQAVMADTKSLGMVFCGSGVGISIAANRVKGVRCVLANSKEIAKLGRLHNGANILSLGERTPFIDDPLEIVETFLTTEVDLSDRHVRRRNLL